MDRIKGQIVEILAPNRVLFESRLSETTTKETMQMSLRCDSPT